MYRGKEYYIIMFPPNLATYGISVSWSRSLTFIARFLSGAYWPEDSSCCFALVNFHAKIAKFGMF